MSVLEATVEIVKGILLTGENSKYHLLTTPNENKDLLNGIENIYKKLSELEGNK